MKRTASLFIVLLILSSLSGYLLSKASLVGRVGISIFYKPYAFLKVWWQAGLLVLLVWTIVFFLLRWAHQKLSFSKARWVSICALVLALVGIYFTYQDFRNNLSHRWLGERFHIGGYLFWMGWILVCSFYLTDSKKPSVEPDPGKEKLPSSHTSPGKRDGENEWK